MEASTSHKSCTTELHPQPPGTPECRSTNWMKTRDQLSTIINSSRGILEGLALINGVLSAPQGSLPPFATSRAWQKTTTHQTAEPNLRIPRKQLPHVVLRGRCLREDRLKENRIEFVVRVSPNNVRSYTHRSHQQDCLDRSWTGTTAECQAGQGTAHESSAPHKATGN